MLRRRATRRRDLWNPLRAVSPRKIGLFEVSGCARSSSRASSDHIETRYRHPRGSGGSRATARRLRWVPAFRGNDDFISSDKALKSGK
jgi:hypothetical protein